jgi:asparagine synthase (glutamine-hydrolysing)
LKKVAERYLPKDIIYRKKMGFGIPTEKWLGDEKLDFKKVMYADWEKIYFSNLKSNKHEI